MKYPFMDEHRGVFRVGAMCAALGVSRSGYYDWRARGPSRRVQANQRLLARIEAIHAGAREHYGAYKTWIALRAEGEACGRHRVARLRQVNGIIAKRVRRFRQVYAARHSAPPAPNWLGRDFTAEHPDRCG